jgi:hypothetical protein
LLELWDRVVAAPTSLTQTILTGADRGARFTATLTDRGTTTNLAFEQWPGARSWGRKLRRRVRKDFERQLREMEQAINGQPGGSRG